MNNLIIMAGGMSSRMKKSTGNSQLSIEQKKLVQKVHKSLIPLGPKKRPLLFYLITNAVAAGYRNIYLITSPENIAFKKIVGRSETNNSYAGAKVHFAIQHLKKGYKKPLGTADAVQQAMEQYPILKEQTFTICNGDNLYSMGALKDLLKPRKKMNALIAYARSSLKFENDRISKFAVMDISKSGFLKEIIEKPDPKTVKMYKDMTGEIRISMNIFSFYGKKLFPFLVACPIHNERKEKELPEAIRLLNKKEPNQIICFNRSEHLLDLTSAEDIASFKNI